jgi:hypothetical protein
MSFPLFCFLKKVKKQNGNCFFVIGLSWWMQYDNNKYEMLAKNEPNTESSYMSNP